MIVPAGKAKSQINQGALQNESIFDSDLFKKIAITGLDLDRPQQQEAVSPDVGPIQDVMNDSQSRLNQNGSPGLNDRGLEQTPGQTPGQIPEQTPFDPFTGKPNVAQAGDFGQIATEVANFVREKFNGQYDVVNLAQGKSGEWTMTFGPKQIGPVVTKSTRGR